MKKWRIVFGWGVGKEIEFIISAKSEEDAWKKAYGKLNKLKSTDIPA